MTNIDYNTLIAEGIKAMRAARNELRIRWIENTNWDIDPQLHAEYAEREWHFDLQRRFKLHPVVVYMLKSYEPTSWQALLLEWPHISETDPGRLAYTRDEAAGKRDLQTVTSVGKYIKRHWPNVPDHKLRDAQATYHPDTVEIVQGVKELIMGVELGPQSCMKSSYGSIPFESDDNRQMKRWIANPEAEEPDWMLHPYSVYAPQYGWKMALRKNAGGEVLGRCLLNENGKVYVRSYQRGKTDSDSSETDHVIEAWLNDRGWKKLAAWPEGCKLAYVEHPKEDGEPLLPYIDGSADNARKVSRCADHFERDNDGEYNCCNTNGEADYEEPPQMVSCVNCGESVDEEDTYGTDDGSVCHYCYNEHYVHAFRGNGRVTVLMLEDYTARVFDSWRAFNVGFISTPVDRENVPSDFVWVESCGCYTEVDNTVRAAEGEYYFTDDPAIVRLSEECPDSGEWYALEEDAWKDRYGNWHSDAVKSVEIDGKLYLEDDCIQCELTGIWYHSTDEFVIMADGRSIAACAFDRVSSDAEWGDDDMTEYRTDMGYKAVLEEARLALERNALARIESERAASELAGAMGVLNEQGAMPEYPSSWFRTVTTATAGNTVTVRAETSKLNTLMQMARAMLGEAPDILEEPSGHEYF